MIVRGWWLSFSDNGLWLGGCAVEARSFTNALTKSHLLGINPGGDVAAAAFEVDPDDIPLDCPLHTLITDRSVLEPMTGADVQEFAAAGKGES